MTWIINLSFATANWPKAFRIAAVTPILKKANLIGQLLNNFCPISNLLLPLKNVWEGCSKTAHLPQSTHTIWEKRCKVYIEDAIPLRWLYLRSPFSWNRWKSIEKCETNGNFTIFDLFFCILTYQSVWGLNSCTSQIHHQETQYPFPHEEIDSLQRLQLFLQEIRQWVAIN